MEVVRYTSSFGPVPVSKVVIETVIVVRSIRRYSTRIQDYESCIPLVFHKTLRSSRSLAKNTRIQEYKLNLDLFSP